MKKTLFKSVCFALLWCGITFQATAQGIVVNKKDGSKVYYKASEVQSVGVFGYGEGPDDMPDEHDWVDLGLPSGTLWATCNVGAENPEDYGDYFAWGETIGYNGGKTTFNWVTYKYARGTSDTLTKYCTDSSKGTVDGKTELDPEDDAATANWGSNWQIPSYEQCEELLDESYTYSTWTTQNGVDGRLITSKINMKTIFLPAAGSHWKEDVFRYKPGSDGGYWIRLIKTSYNPYANALHFNSGYIEIDSRSEQQRFFGQSIRPVRKQ